MTLLVLTGASAVAVAVINGLIVVKTKIPSFIATLGMAFFSTGASIFVNGLTPAVFIPGVRTDTLVSLFAGNHGYFRSQIVWLLR